MERLLTHDDEGDRRSMLRAVSERFVAKDHRRELSLRKTALGASSPAKPALHIPELFECQSAIKTSPQVPLIDFRREIRGNKSFEARGFSSGLVTYPLSITRAATSSIRRQSHQHQPVLPDGYSDKRKTWNDSRLTLHGDSVPVDHRWMENKRIRMTPCGGSIL